MKKYEKLFNITKEKEMEEIEKIMNYVNFDLPDVLNTKESYIKGDNIYYDPKIDSLNEYSLIRIPFPQPIVVHGSRFLEFPDFVQNSLIGQQKVLQDAQARNEVVSEDTNNALKVSRLIERTYKELGEDYRRSCLFLKQYAEDNNLSENFKLSVSYEIDVLETIYDMYN